MNEGRPVPGAEPASGRAIAALVLGVLGLAQVLPCIGPIAAIVLGSGEESSVGRAARILGWVGLVLSLLAALVFLALFVFGLGIAAMTS